MDWNKVHQLEQRLKEIANKPRSYYSHPYFEGVEDGETSLAINLLNEFFVFKKLNDATTD